MMNRWIFSAIAWLITLHVASATESRLGDLLHLPPVMARSVGNPKVEISVTPGTGSEAVVNLRRPALRAPKTAKIDAIRVERPKATTPYLAPLAQHLLEYFWDRRVEAIEKGDRSLPLIPMSRERFIAIGVGQLTGKPVRDEVGNAWWKVRMDEPLTPDDDHHLIIMAAKSPAEFYSHFALGLRTAGSTGVRRSEWVLDPRAPWLKDEHPTMIDWFNLDNSMIMTVEVSHLSDWLYTQTAYRGYGVTMQFTPATEEYVTLLKAAGQGDHLRTANLGPFKPLRHNCATHGQELVEALLPLGEKLCGRHPVADLPVRLLRKTGRRLGEVITVELPPQPAPPGVEQSQNSTLRTSPNPTALPEVQQLRKVPEINGKSQ